MKVYYNDEEVKVESTVEKVESTIAGIVLTQFPDLSPVALVAIVCALGILGSTFIEEYLKKNVNKWGG